MSSPTNEKTLQRAPAPKTTPKMPTKRGCSCSFFSHPPFHVTEQRLPHEKSRVPKCSGKPMRSAHIQLNRHFRVRVLPPQPRSQSLSKSSGGPVSMVSGTMLRRLNAAFLLHRFRGGWPASNRNPGWHQFGIPGRNASESAASKWPVPP
jgi:hypothetical protein